MKESRKKIILNARKQLMSDQVERAERDGIELEKGATITNEWLEQHREMLEKWMNLFTAYPDV